MLELSLLGFPKLFFENEALSVPSSKSLAMLCYLACQREPLHRKELAELLWATTNTGSVRVALSELRSLKGSDDWLMSQGQLLSVKAKTDIHKFEHAVSKERFQQALELWDTAPETLFLKSLEVKKAPDFNDWLELERSRLSDLHSQALQGQIKVYKNQKHYDKALELAQDILAKDKLNEDVHRQIIKLEHLRGNTEGALRQFETLRNILQTELGVEPLPDTLALLKEIEHSSVSAGKTALLLTNPKAIPALPEKLIGRDDLLNSIAESLKAHPRLLLHGFGGTGKTALAASFAKHYLAQARHQQNNSSILWIQAADDSTEVLFDAIARVFKAQQELSQSDNKNKTLKDLLAKNTQLFILDDAWNAYALSKLLDVLPENLPFIVTARQRYPQLKRLDVGRLKREDALELLSYYTDIAQAPLPSPSPLMQTPSTPKKGSSKRPKSSLPNSDENANALCALLGDHPLALRIAGLTLATQQLNPKALLKQIKDNPHSMKAPAEFAEEGRESVAALLATSAKTLSDAAYEALLACGSLHTSSCTPELLALALRRSEEETEKALLELQKRGLSDRQSEAGNDLISYRFHDLVFSFAKANTNLRASTIMQAGRIYLENHKRDFNALDAEINNLLGCAQNAQNEHPELFINMMSTLAVGDAYYMARGHSPSSLKLLISASELAKSLKDLEAAHYLYARVGDTYRVLYANYDKAFEAYERALSLARIIKNKHLEAISLTLIGIVEFQRQSNEELKYFELAEEIAQGANDHLALSLILQHKGFISGHSNDWNATQTLSLKAIEIAHHIRANDQLHYAQATERLFFALLNLGEAQRRLGNFSEALITRTSALRLAEDENKQIWIAYALQEIGEMYHDAQKEDLALPKFEEALKIYRENNANADIQQVESFLEKHNYYDSVKL